MPEIEYTWDDVSRLGDKVNTLNLSEAESALMAAMLGLANDMISGRGPEGGVRLTPGDRGVVEYDAMPELGSQVIQAMHTSSGPSPVGTFRVIPN
jgi:hypothetical protein